MSREHVIEMIMDARTLADIKHAFEARDEYLTDHPKDYEIIDYGGFLMRLQEALEMLESEQLARTA